MNLKCLGLFVLVLSARHWPLAAQRLLWERSNLHPGATQDWNVAVLPTPNGAFLVAGFTPLPRPTGATCFPAWRGLLQTWDTNGVLLRERLGRGSIIGGCQELTPAVPGGRAAYWWTGNQVLCPSTGRRMQSVLLPTKATGDTLRGSALAGVSSDNLPRVILAHGNRVVVAGSTYVSAPASQFQQHMLACSDTSGRVLWQYAYARQPLANDFCTGLAHLPNGGYLLTGDGQVNGSGGLQHLFTETDSMGNLRRQQLLYPLGPDFNDGDRNNGNCNVLVLPNHGGYIVSGTADSASGGSSTLRRRVGYIMRVDTALQKVWTCRIPSTWGGRSARNQFAYRVRQLPDGTLTLLLRDIGATVTDLHLVQVSLQGQLLRHYFLPSNAYADVVPLDWQWLADGTLVLCGTARSTGNATALRAYLARWNFSGTALLGAHNPTEATTSSTFTLYPNPSTGPVTLTWQQPPAARAGQLHLYSPLGQLVKTLALPPTASGRLEVAGLAPGLYLARLLDAAGAGQGRAQRLLVRE